MSENTNFDPIENFVEELVRQANIQLPEDELNAYKERLYNLALERIGLVSLNLLKKEDLAEFEKFFEKQPSQKEMQDFFSSRIENYPEKIAQALEDFAREFFATYYTK